MIIKSLESKMIDTESRTTAQSGCQDAIFAIFTNTVSKDLSQQKKKESQEQILSSHDFISFANIPQKNSSLQIATEKPGWTTGQEHKNSVEDAQIHVSHVNKMYSPDKAKTLPAEQLLVLEDNLTESAPAGVQAEFKNETFRRGVEEKDKQTEALPKLQALLDEAMVSAFDANDSAIASTDAVENYYGQTELLGPVNSKFPPVPQEAEKAVDNEGLDFGVDRQISVLNNGEVINGTVDFNFKEPRFTSYSVRVTSLSQHLNTNNSGFIPEVYTQMHSQAVNTLSYVRPNFAGSGYFNTHSIETTAPSEYQPGIISGANVDESINQVQIKHGPSQYLYDLSIGSSELVKFKMSSPSTSYAPESFVQSQIFQKRYHVLETNGKIIVRIRDFFLSSASSSNLLEKLQIFCNENSISSLTVTLNGVTTVLKGV